MSSDLGYKAKELSSSLRGKISHEWVYGTSDKPITRSMGFVVHMSSKELVRNLPKLKFDQHFSDACKFGKQAHASHKAKNIVSATRCLELLHTDLFGPSIVQSYEGNRYTLVIVDDYSRYTWTRFLKDKIKAFDQIDKFSNKIQNQLGCTIVSIRTDDIREYDNEVKFKEFCNANGITHNFSAPRTPESNGLVKRKNRTLQEMSRTMLNEQSLPQRFWCNAKVTSTYILNRILVRAILGKTPYELLREDCHRRQNSKNPGRQVLRHCRKYQVGRKEFIDEFGNKIFPSKNGMRGFFFEPMTGCPCEREGQKNKLNCRIRHILVFDCGSYFVKPTNVIMRIVLFKSEELVRSHHINETMLELEMLSKNWGLGDCQCVFVVLWGGVLRGVTLVWQVAGVKGIMNSSGYSQNSKAYIMLNKHTRKIEESLNPTFDETPPPCKTSPLVDDDLDEEEAVKVTEKKNLEIDIEDETLEIDEIVNIKESRNHPLKNVIGNLNQRTLRSQAKNQ
nr:retrovirus-related Pol polyprotein from transposon TNT 1-94 [Tanacetum cinerariifolium]